MDIRQLYEKTGGNFEDVLKRLGSEAMIQRFVLKFAKDPSFGELTRGMEEQDAELAFRAAHTLKGICLNLGFDRLYAPTAALTEDLRGRAFSGQSEELYHRVKTEYGVLIAVIAEWA